MASATKRITRKQVEQKEQSELRQTIRRRYRAILEEIKRLRRMGYKSWICRVHSCPEGGKRYLGRQIQKQLTEKLTSKRNGFKVKPRYRREQPAIKGSGTDVYFYELKISW